MYADCCEQLHLDTLIYMSYLYFKAQLMNHFMYRFSLKSSGFISSLMAAQVLFLMGF